MSDVNDDTIESSSTFYSRPDPPSSWEIYQEQYESELEFLDTGYHDNEDPPMHVEHSLPSVEEVYADRKWRGGNNKLGSWKTYSTRSIVMIAISIVALVTIISLAVGSTRSKGDELSLAPGGDEYVGGDEPGNELFDEDPAARDSDLLNLLFSVYQKAGLDANVLTSIGSPQFQALQWVADVDTRRVEIGPSVVQRYVLAVLYFALGGNEWRMKEIRWMSKAHECDWNFGLSADQIPPSSDTKDWRIGAHCSGGNREIDRIFLPSNNLQGEMPQEIGLLTTLYHFSVYNNQLRGSLPMSMRLLTSLQFLNIENNQFSGTLGQWFSFPDLEYLNLAHNQFSGDLPSSFYEMTSLYEAALNNNAFTGGVDVLSECRGLKILYLQNNQLDGALSEDSFADYMRLQDLDMSDNKLRGVFPQALYRVSNVDLHKNQLSGSLPEVPLEFIHNIRFLSLYQNKLTGAIPSSIGFLSSLTHLDLSQNQLTGMLLDGFEQLNGLEYLFLQKNPFLPGPIPNVYGLSSLKELSLQETNRNSSLPEYIGDTLTNLTLLDLHQNSLTGSIPSNWGGLSKMRFLFLNKNQLSGNLPYELMFMKMLAIFMIDQNEFVGSDTAVCGDNLPSTLTQFVADCDEIECQCCTSCCASNDPSCNTLELRVNDDNNFSRDHLVFSENLIINQDN